MIEFLIKRTDGDWFDLKKDQFLDTLRPNTKEWKVVEGAGDHRIHAVGTDISFSYEDPGIQVTFESDQIEEAVARHVVDEVLENVQRATGQKGEVIPL